MKTGEEHLYYKFKIYLNFTKRGIYMYIWLVWMLYNNIIFVNFKIKQVHLTDQQSMYANLQHLKSVSCYLTGDKKFYWNDMNQLNS